MSLSCPSAGLTPWSKILFQLWNFLEVLDKKNYCDYYVVSDGVALWVPHMGYMKFLDKKSYCAMTDDVALWVPQMFPFKAQKLHVQHWQVGYLQYLQQDHSLNFIIRA